jgi:hypothetical protein
MLSFLCKKRLVSKVVVIQFEISTTRHPIEGPNELLDSNLKNQLDYEFISAH